MIAPRRLAPRRSQDDGPMVGERAGGASSEADQVRAGSMIAPKPGRAVDRSMIDGGRAPRVDRAPPTPPVVERLKVVGSAQTG